MVNVKYPFHFFLNWNPAYSYCELPKDYTGEIPVHWQKLLEKIPDEISKTKVSDITIRNVTARNEDDYQGISRAFNIEAFEDVPIERLTFDHVSLSCREFGIINYVKDLRLLDTQISVFGARDEKNDEYDNR